LQTFVCKAARGYFARTCANEHNEYALSSMP
jgi:hypothetical protein